MYRALTTNCPHDEELSSRVIILISAFFLASFLSYHRCGKKGARRKAVHDDIVSLAHKVQTNGRGGRHCCPKVHEKIIN